MFKDSDERMKTVAENNMPDLSKIWPEWKAVKKVGEGSYGKVYRCVRDEYGIRSVCAIKIISIPQNPSELESVKFEGFSEAAAKSYFEELVRDFSNEIKMMLVLKGASNIVAVENYKIVEKTDTIGWDIYIRMEFLTSFIKFSSGLEFNEPAVKRFGLDLCNALDICSKRGIVHRDIKPDNIFVDDYGSYKIGDFGVAKRLEGTVGLMSKKGTYAYMAPEVFRGDQYDSRADIYSLGMVMYKLLNRNRDPFVNQEKQYISLNERNEAFERRRNGEALPPPVDASPEMAQVILKACAFNPDDRFATAKEFKKALLALDIDVDEDNLFNEYKEKQMLEEIEPEPVVESEDDEKTEILDGTEAVMFEVANALKDQYGRNYEENDGQAEHPEVYTGEDIPIGKNGKDRNIKKIIIPVAAILVIAALAAVLFYGNGRWFNVAESVQQTESGQESKESPEEAMAFLEDIEVSFIDGTKTEAEIFAAAKPYLEFYDEQVSSFAEEICLSAEEKAYNTSKQSYDAKNYVNALKITSGMLGNGSSSAEITGIHTSAMNAELALIDEKIEKTNQYGAILDALNELSPYCISEAETAEVELRKLRNNANKNRDAQKVFAYGAEVSVEGRTQVADFSVRNEDASGKTVAHVKFSIFEFDASGKPVTVSTQSQRGKFDNERLGHIAFDIGAYETYETVNDEDFWLPIERRTTQVMVCVRSVEFSDGTVWENPYYAQWLELYNASYENIE